MNLLSRQPIASQFLLDQPTHGLINTTSDIQGIIINNQNSEQVYETLSFKLIRGYQLPPKFYARYSLENELGSGGFGFVASIKEKTTGQYYAIKFIYKNKLPPSSWMTTTQGQRIPMEIYILQHVRHRTIVDYVDSFEDETFFYLVMEIHGTPWHAYSSSLLDLPSLTSNTNYSHNDTHQQDGDHPTSRRRGSCDLFGYMDYHGALDEPLAKLIFRQIVECVADLDKMGICHRDLKDENFVKLIDFGSSVLLPRHFDRNDKQAVVARPRSFYGTPAYASPEILRMESYRVEPAEIWSLGVLLYMLVFAEMPFTNPRMILTAQVPLPSSTTVSAQCVHIITLLLDKSPSRRPTAHQILTHPWLQQE